MKLPVRLWVGATMVSLSLMTTACSPEVVLARGLLGDWEVTSFTSDGEELIGFLITTLDIEFKEYDGDEGDFTFNFVFENGTTTSTSGEYQINADGTEIDFNYDDGTSEEWDVEQDGDDLTLEATLDGVRYVMRADRD